MTGSPVLTNVRISRLASGLRVVTASVPYVQSVSVGIWIGCGSRDENSQLAGISHFIEHLLFKGTRTRSAHEIACAIEAKGGYLNAFTQEELTCYYARVPSEHLEETLDILGDLIVNPLLRSEDVAKEREVIVEEIMTYRDQPQHRVQEILTAALWPDHPLGRPVTGFPESLARIRRKDIIRFMNDHYVPERIVCVAAGQVEHEKCVRQVENLMRLRSRGRVPRRQRLSPRVRQRRIVIEERNVEQPHVAMAVRLPFGRFDSRRYPLRLLNAILGENMSSRLFQVVREQYGLAYSIQSFVEHFSETGALFVCAGLDRDRVAKGVEVIVRELQRIRNHGVSRNELVRAKDYVVGQLKLSLESVTNQMMGVGESFLLRGRFISPESIIRRICAVRVEDVDALGAAILRPSRMSFAMACPPSTGFNRDMICGLIARF